MHEAIRLSRQRPQRRVSSSKTEYRVVLPERRLEPQTFLEHHGQRHLRRDHPSDADGTVYPRRARHTAMLVVGHVRDMPERRSLGRPVAALYLEENVTEAGFRLDEVARVEALRLRCVRASHELHRCARCPADACADRSRKGKSVRSRTHRHRRPGRSSR